MDNSGGSGIGSLLQFLPGFLQLMKGMNNTSQKNTTAQLSNVNNAMVNPNNPLYQQMYGQYKQQGQQQLGENISQIEGQNRSLAAMGRTPLFAPERQGEQTFRAQAAAGPQIGIQAGQQTQQALMNAAQGLYGAGRAGGVNSQLLTSQYGPNTGGAANQSMMGLTQLGNMFGRQQQQPQQMQQPPQNLAQALPWLSQGQGLNAPGASQSAWGSPKDYGDWSL